MSVDITNNITEAQRINQNKMTNLDTRVKLRKLQENKIRDYYSRIFKNENNSLVKQGIIIRSSVGNLSKTLKKQGFKVQSKKLTLKIQLESPNNIDPVTKF